MQDDDAFITDEAKHFLRLAFCKGLTAKTTFSGFKTAGYSLLCGGGSGSNIRIAVLDKSIYIGCVLYGEHITDSSAISRQDYVTDKLSKLETWDLQLKFLSPTSESDYFSLLDKRHQFGQSDTRTYWTIADKVCHQCCYLFNPKFRNT